MKSSFAPFHADCPRRFRGIASLAALTLTCASVLAVPGHAATPVSDAVKAQIADVLAVKATFSPAEKKMPSGLVFALRKANGENIGTAAAALLASSPAAGTAVQVEVHGKIKNRLKKSIGDLGGTVGIVDKLGHRLTATVPLGSLRDLAANKDVAHLGVTRPLHANVGLLATQGIIAHGAKKVVKSFGYDGTGVKVGVVSTSATPERVAALIASGDLGPDTTVLDPGFTTDDEGTAMMEIVQDMAPGATMYFASGFTDFAGNIRALQAAGCQVIVDDLGGPEGVFQDDDVALAVDDVTAKGAIYLSSAGNSGNLSDGTSNVWEGDFLPGDALGTTYVVHNFGTADAPADANAIVYPGYPYQFLTWADPLNDSTNDYDFFVVDSTGTVLKGFSVDTQTPDSPGYPAELLGTPDYVIGGNYTDQEVGDQFIIAKSVAAAPLALHMDVEEGILNIGTGGATYGHNAAANTVCCAATYWDSAATGVRRFDGVSNYCEQFSSDGPRKIFFNPDGTPITPGNFLFATQGGTTLQKPDVTGADGVMTTTPGFLPFFGTSAASPHVAGIAALMISARQKAKLPALTPAQLHQVIDETALDNEEAGVDPLGGYGVADAVAAVKGALVLLAAP